jgi:hypothetical protein
MLTFYFIFLSIGIFLYMIEYAGRGSLLFKIVAYGITFAWMAFNWLYVRVKTAKKQQDAVNEIIGKLEEVNKQLLE